MSGPARQYLAMRLVEAFAFALFTTAAVLRRIQVVGLDPLELALVGTALEVTTFLCEVPTGLVADLRSRRLSIAIGYVLLGVGFAFEAFSFGLAAVLLAQVVWGLGWTFLSGAREAWLADEIGDEPAARAFVRAARFMPLARLVGIGLAIGLGAVSLHHPMWLGGALMLGLGVVLRVRLPELGFTPAPHLGGVAARLRGTFVAGTRAARARPVIGLLFAATFFFGFASEGIDRLWEFHLLERHGLPFGGALPAIFWFGGIQAVGLLLSVLALGTLERRLDASDPRRVGSLLVALFAALALAVALLAWSPGFAVAAAALWAITLLRQIETPYTDAWLNRGLDPATRATVLSMYSQCHAFGEIGGGPLLGGVARLASVPLALTGSALLLLPSLGFVARARAREAART